MNMFLHDIKYGVSYPTVALIKKGGKNHSGRVLHWSGLIRKEIYHRDTGGTEAHEGVICACVMSYRINQLTHEVIGSAIEVHKQLGPGLLESAYRKCLCRELIMRGVSLEYEQPLPLEYKGLKWTAAIAWILSWAAWLLLR